MRLGIKILFFISIFLSNSDSFSQQLDTIWHGCHYHNVTYFCYNDEKLLSSDNKDCYYAFGDYRDSLKSGLWVYFYPSGKPMAKGKYRKNGKIGVWKYYYEEKKRPYSKIRFIKYLPYKSYYGFDKNGDLLLYDVSDFEEKNIKYRNGFKVISKGQNVIED